MLLVGTTVATLLGLVAAAWSMSRSERSAPWAKRLLLCGAVASPVQVAAYLVLGQWWAATMCALIGVALVVFWEGHREADGQRIWLQPWLDRNVVRRLPLSRRRIDRIHAASGRSGLTLPDIRAEYAGPILEDADRDPQLDALLNTICARLLADVLRVEAETDPGGDGPVPPLLTRYIALTGIANRVLALATEPGAAIGNPYLGYSQPMLTLAAACRLDGSAQLRPRPSR